MTLSPPRVVAVTTVDVKVVLVTLVARLEFPSASPRVARVESPRSSWTLPKTVGVPAELIGFRRMDSRLVKLRDPWVGAVTVGGTIAFDRSFMFDGTTVEDKIKLERTRVLYIIIFVGDV